MGFLGRLIRNALTDDALFMERYLCPNGNRVHVPTFSPRHNRLSWQDPAPPAAPRFLESDRFAIVELIADDIADIVEAALEGLKCK